MKKILFIISIIMCSETFAQSYNEYRCHVDSNLRYSNIIGYIKNDSIIDRIIYKYYPPITCFDFPDTSKFMIIGPNEYFLLKGDTAKKKNITLFKIRHSGILDSINQYRFEKYEKMNTNFNEDNNCDSVYNFSIGFISNKIWVVAIIPKKITPGIYRSISYVFLFDDKDSIIKTITHFAQE
ncbi:MAG: hypothetical protein V1779_00915 [bacterium]